MMTASHLFRLLAVFAVFIPFAASAQQSALQEIEENEVPYLLDAPIFSMNFVRDPKAAPNEATLRLSQSYSVSGCVNIKPMTVTPRIAGQRLEYTVSEPVVTLSKEPQYSQFDCKPSVNTVTTDIVFNRDIILEKKINKVTLRGPGGQDQYEIYANEHTLSLYTKVRDPMTGKYVKSSDGKGKEAFKPLKSTQRDDPLTYWFYPENTLVLYVPGTSENPGQLAERVHELAGKYGMIEAKFAMPGFVSPLKDQNVFYYVDQVGLHANKIRQNGAGPFGNITVKEMFQGPEGPHEKDTVVAVYARLPGLMD